MADEDDRESIGPGGTIPTRPGNPLYDAVKSGGGYVVDEESGEVTGGPDDDSGDSDSSEESPSSSGESDGSSGGSASETNAQTRNRLIRQSGSSGGGSSSRTSKDQYGSLGDDRVQNTGPSGAASSGDSSSPPDPSKGGSSPPEEPESDISFGGLQERNQSALDNIQGPSRSQSGGGAVPNSVEQDVQSDALSQLNSQASGTPFDSDDVQVSLTRRDGQQFATASLSPEGESTADAIQSQRRQREKERLRQQLQDETEATLSDSGITITEDDGQFVAELTAEGRRQEAAARADGQETATNSGGQTGDIFSGAVSSFEETTGVDVPGDGSLVNQGRENREDVGSGNQTGREGFGGRSDAEQQIRDSVDTVISDYVEPAASATGDLVEIGAASFAASSPVEAEDPARAAGSDQTGQQAGEVAEGGVLAAGDVARLPVTAIEAGEFALAGVESAEITKARPDSDLGEFADDAAAAGAVAGAETAQAAANNPEQVAGQIIAGAAVGSAARTAIRGRGSGGGAPDTDAGSTPGGTGNTGSTGVFGDRTPNVDVDAGRNAARGNVELNMNADLQRRIGERVSGAESRVSDGLERAGAAVDNTAETVRRAPDTARQRAGQSLRNTEVSADAAVAAGRDLADGTVESIRGRSSAVADAVYDAPETAVDAARTAGRAGRDRAITGLRNTEVSADAAVAAGRELFSDSLERGTLAARRARRDLDLPTIPRGFVTEDTGGRSLFGDTGTGRAQPLGGLDSVGDVVGRTRDRTASAVRNTEISADATVTAGRERVSDVLDRAAVGARRARRDIGLPELPRGFVTEDSGGRSFLGDTGTRRAQPVDPLDTALSAGERAADRVRSLSDFGIRVDVGKPRTRTVDAEDMEFGDAGVSYDRDFDGDLEGGDTGDPVEIFSVDADDAGGGTMALRRTDTDSSGTARADAGTVDSPRRRDSGGLFGGVLGGAGSAFGSGTGLGAGSEPTPGLDFDTVADSAVDSVLGPDTGTGVSPDTGTDVGPDTGSVAGSGTGSLLGPDYGTDTSGGFGSDLDQTFEQEAVLDQRSGGQRSRKRLGIDLDGGDSEDDPLASAFAIDSEAFDTGVSQSVDDALSGFGRR